MPFEPHDKTSELSAAIAAMPAGAWAVGVSGGADSVALLCLLLQRRNLQVHVAHLDHQTRQGASTQDAIFVADLAHAHGLACTVETLSTIEAADRSLSTVANPSARYRLARHALFRQVVTRYGLEGVILAHHADDQAETILHRLLRGSGTEGLAGMSADTTVGGLRILRPLLNVSRDTLRQLLLQHRQPWREDTSNTSNAYLRNRLRKALNGRAELKQRLLELGRAAGALRKAVRNAAPQLPPAFPMPMLADLPDILALESARRWLRGVGCPAQGIAPATLLQLLAMARDAASSARTDFPGQVVVRRRKRQIFTDRGLP